MDNFDSKKANLNKKLEAVHLLPEIDVKSVKNYVSKLISLHYIKKSAFTARCFICNPSLLQNWQIIMQHLRNPSHIDNINRESKQFTAICIVCRYIFISNDANCIFEHFMLHKAASNQSDEPVVTKSSENDPIIPSSSIGFSSLIYKANRNIGTSLTKQNNELQKEKVYCDKQEDINEGIKLSGVERHKSSLSNPCVEHFDKTMKKNLVNRHVISPINSSENKTSSSKISSNATTCTSVSNLTPTLFNNHCKNNNQEIGKKNSSICQKINMDDGHGIRRQPNIKLTCIKSPYEGVVTANNQRLIHSSSFGVVSPIRRDSSNTESVKVVSFQNSNPGSSEKRFHPKEVFFSNRTIQLVSPGVSTDEFSIRQELNNVNIHNYCIKSYYSLYYSLRKLYFSCLECNALRLQENDFYKHITGIKHYNNIGDCYDIALIKICDICQLLLLGHIDLIKKHFESNAHQQNVKCKMVVIEEQSAVMSGDLKLGFSGELTDRCKTLFSSKEALDSWVESSLKEAREVASLAESLSRILERDIKKALKEKYTNFHVKVVGSRLYELANHQSDVDIHLNIGDVSVGDLEEYFLRAEDLFEVERTILDAKVPIIRLKHLKSSLICDVNTTNPTGVYCSELIKLYISLDERVRWLAMAIMKWSAENGIRGTRKFKSYAIICIVLFFLMSPKINLIPSVHKLKSLFEGSRVYIKGWDYSFCRDIEKIKNMHNPLLCNLNKYELLAEFFKYYSSLNIKGNVLFPHNGEIYRKVVFANPLARARIYPGIHTNEEDKQPLSVGGRFIVIDFFCLRENINKSVDENLLDHFKCICHKTLLCGWLN